MLVRFFRWWKGEGGGKRPSARRSLPRRPVFLEGPQRLEDRDCPAVVMWQWIGGTDNKWSAPAGGDWKNGVAFAAAGDYPGKNAGQTDVVTFDAGGKGKNCTLDVALTNPIDSLFINGWGNTLTLATNLTVTDPGGSFSLQDASTISLNANVNLTLQDLGTAGPNPNVWNKGTITGGMNSSFQVIGTFLNIQTSPAGLGTNMTIASSAKTGNPGTVVLSQMTGNLNLFGSSNYIDVQGGGSLNLYQVVQTGRANFDGGIDLGPTHTGGKVAVQVESGGTLERRGPGLDKALNQVEILGAVYNMGGTVKVDTNSLLSITGTDAKGYSYWQQTNATATLSVDSTSTIKASGTYQIDAGTVLLTAPGGGAFDELDGNGLNFGATNPTGLSIQDATSKTPGTVTVQGPVTLAANTTTTMNFNGGANTADKLDVKGGALTLAGKLSLFASDNKKPGAVLTFFDDQGATAVINGDFASIVDNVGGTDKGAVVGAAPLVTYQVTIK